MFQFPEEGEERDGVGTHVTVVRTESHVARFNTARALFEKMAEKNSGVGDQRPPRSHGQRHHVGGCPSGGPAVGRGASSPNSGITQSRSPSPSSIKPVIYSNGHATHPFKPASSGSSSIATITTISSTIPATSTFYTSIQNPSTPSVLHLSSKKLPDSYEANKVKWPPPQQPPVKTDLTKTKAASVDFPARTEKSTSASQRPKQEDSCKAEIKLKPDFDGKAHLRNGISDKFEMANKEFFACKPDLLAKGDPKTKLDAYSKPAKPAKPETLIDKPLSSHLQNQQIIQRHKNWFQSYSKAKSPVSPPNKHCQPVSPTFGILGPPEPRSPRELDKSMSFDNVGLLQKVKKIPLSEEEMSPTKNIKSFAKEVQVHSRKQTEDASAHHSDWRKERAVILSGRSSRQCVEDGGGKGVSDTPKVKSFEDVPTLPSCWSPPKQYNQSAAATHEKPASVGSSKISLSPSSSSVRASSDAAIKRDDAQGRVGVSPDIQRDLSNVCRELRKGLSEDVMDVHGSGQRRMPPDAGRRRSMDSVALEGSVSPAARRDFFQRESEDTSSECRARPIDEGEVIWRLRDDIAGDREKRLKEWEKRRLQREHRPGEEVGVHGARTGDECSRRSSMPSSDFLRRTSRREDRAEWDRKKVEARLHQHERSSHEKPRSEELRRKRPEEGPEKARKEEDFEMKRTEEDEREKKRKETEEERINKRKEEEEEASKTKEELEKRRREEFDKRRKEREEIERLKKREEIEKKKREELEKRGRERDEFERKKREEEREKKSLEILERKKRELELEKKRKEEEAEKERKRKLDLERRKEELERRKAQELERRKREKEELERRKREKEELERRKREKEELERRKREKEELERKREKEQLERKKREEEVLERRRKEEELLERRREAELEKKREQEELERQRREEEELERQRREEEELERQRREEEELEKQRREEEELERQRREEEELEKQRREEEELEKQRREEEELEKQRREEEELEKQRREEEELEKQRREEEELEKQRREEEELERQRREHEELERGRREQEEVERQRREQEEVERQRREHEELERQMREHEELERQRREQEELERQMRAQEELERQKREQEKLERQKREQEEVERQKREQEELERQRREQEELERQRREQEELERQRREQEELERQRREQEELERQRREQEELERQRREQEELERQRREQEELERQRREQEELERQRREQEELERQRREQEELERQRREQEELERQRRGQEELERQRREQEELERQRREQEELERQRREQEELERQRREQEELKRQRREQEELKRKRREQEELERQRREQEELERQRREQAKLERQRREQEELEGQRREQEELERQRREQEELERQRREQEELERQRREQEELERQRREQKKLERQRREQGELERQRREQGELERQRREQGELERQRREQEELERQRREQEELERQRREQEELERQRREQEELERQRREQEELERQSREQEELERQSREQEELERQSREQEELERQKKEEELERKEEEELVRQKRKEFQRRREEDFEQMRKEVTERKRKEDEEKEIEGRIVEKRLEGVQKRRKEEKVKARSEFDEEQDEYERKRKEDQERRKREEEKMKEELEKKWQLKREKLEEEERIRREKDRLQIEKTKRRIAELKRERDEMRRQQAIRLRKLMREETVEGFESEEEEEEPEREEEVQNDDEKGSEWTQQRGTETSASVEEDELWERSPEEVKQPPPAEEAPSVAEMKEGMPDASEKGENVEAIRSVVEKENAEECVLPTGLEGGSKKVVVSEEPTELDAAESDQEIEEGVKVITVMDSTAEPTKTCLEKQQTEPKGPKAEEVFYDHTVISAQHKIQFCTGPYHGSPSREEPSEKSTPSQSDQAAFSTISSNFEPLPPPIPPHNVDPATLTPKDNVDNRLPPLPPPGDDSLPHPVEPDAMTPEEEQKLLSHNILGSKRGILSDSEAREISAILKEAVKGSELCEEESTRDHEEDSEGVDKDYDSVCVDSPTPENEDENLSFFPHEVTEEGFVIRAKEILIEDGVHYFEDGHFWIQVPGLTDDDDDDLPESVPVHEHTKLKFSKEPIKLFSTFSVTDYDRKNEDVDPVAASAEYELEKRVEKMDVFPVQIEKGEGGLGLSIIGMGVGADAGVEKLGIFVKTITPGGSTDKDGRIKVNDQIIEVDNQSLVGVTQMFAASVLKNTSGSVNFLIGRETDPENSEVAMLIRQSLLADQERDERRRALEGPNYDPRNAGIFESFSSQSGGESPSEETPRNHFSHCEEEVNQYGEEFGDAYGSCPPSPMEGASSPTPEAFNHDVVTKELIQNSDMMILSQHLEEAQQRNEMYEEEINILRAKITQLEKELGEKVELASSLHETTLKLKDVEDKLQSRQAEIATYQDMLEQSQGQYIILEKKYYKAKKIIKEYQSRERDFLHREEYHITQLEEKDALYNSLVKALKDRVIQLEGDLIKAQQQAGLPIKVPPDLNAQSSNFIQSNTQDNHSLLQKEPPRKPSTISSLDADLSDTEGADTHTSEGSKSSTVERKIPSKEELDVAVPPTELLDNSFSKAKGELASRGGLANRQLPSLKKTSSTASANSFDNDADEAVDESLPESQQQPHSSPPKSPPAQPPEEVFHQSPPPSAAPVTTPSPTAPTYPHPSFGNNGGFGGRLPPPYHTPHTQTSSHPLPPHHQPPPYQPPPSAPLSHRPVVSPDTHGVRNEAPHRHPPPIARVQPVNRMEASPGPPPHPQHHQQQQAQQQVQQPAQIQTQQQTLAHQLKALLAEREANADHTHRSNRDRSPLKKSPSSLMEDVRQAVIQADMSIGKKPLISGPIHVSSTAQVVSTGQFVHNRTSPQKSATVATTLQQRISRDSGSWSSKISSDVAPSTPTGGVVLLSQRPIDASLPSAQGDENEAVGSRILCSGDSTSSFDSQPQEKISSGKAPRESISVFDWTKEQVAQWLVVQGLENYVSTFMSAGITGPRLVNIDTKDLKSLGLSSDDKNKIKRKVKELRQNLEKERKQFEKENKEREKLQKKAEKLAEKAERRKK